MAELPRVAPEKRWGHESALIDGHLYLFGGRAGSKFFGRYVVWEMDLRVEEPERKWLRRSARVASFQDPIRRRGRRRGSGTRLRLDRARTIPPACEGARCVVIDEMIYSYGGSKEDWRFLGVVYRLDPKKMEWIEVATPSGGKNPAPRAYCSLCAIGSRIIMFGGESDAISPDRLQSGATQEDDWNNEIYEFLFEEGRDKGVWSDLNLIGTRPKPLMEASMATIDEHRAFLLGIDIREESYAFMLNVQIQCWTSINFDVNPSPRLGHTIFQLGNTSRCLLIGGENISSSDSMYELNVNIDDCIASRVIMDTQRFENVYRHASHWFQGDSRTSAVVIYDEGLKFFKFLYGSRNEGETTAFPYQIGRHEMETIQSELQRLRRGCALLEEEVERREEHTVAVRRCQTLEASRVEMKNRLDEFLDVLSINPDELHLTEQSLGSGAFAGVCIGLWRGTKVAVKKFHQVLANPRNLALFRREVLVCSRLHHPNIMTICGAVMQEDVPLQMVMELLEGSVSEVINAAHAASGSSVGSSYLTFFEQLSIAMDVTSAIAYLHQTRPKPYVHGDIRPSNVLVTRDMKSKVGDLGAAHIVESSLSVGPLSLDYVSPERMPRDDGTAIKNTLPSDVYSMGVSLIEIFTGARPIPEERQTQLLSLEARQRLFVLCSDMIDHCTINRPTSQNCFEKIKAETESVLAIPGFFAGKRFVKGVFERHGHKVVLSTSLNAE